MQMPIRFLLVCLVGTLAGGRRVTTQEGAQTGTLGHAQYGHLRAEGEAEAFEHKSSKDKENPFGSVIGGLLLWCLVPVFLWNNERIAIKQYKMQFKAERWAIHIDEPEREPLKEMDGHIVYLTGTSTCEEVLKDSQFSAVHSEGKIKLRRCVQMYQWVEHESEEGEGDNKRTVYSWTQEWSDTFQQCPHGESDRQNPPMPMPSSRRQEPYRASAAVGAGNGEDCAEAAHDKVRLGAYYLGDYVIRELQQWKNKEDVKPEHLKTKRDRMTDDAILNDGFWYFGDATNTIGAVRVSFEELHCGPISIVGVLTKTEKGSTFVPIKRPDAAGTGDSAAAEICGSCCVRVKELHYAEEDEDAELKDDLKGRPAELTKQETKAFVKAKTAANVEEYSIEENTDDLCCVGPFGGAVIKLMHWFGLEEEFLAVREKNMPLEQVIDAENDEAAQRHHIARIVGFLLLVMGGFMIISPVVKMLNYNWITTLLGGGLISAVLCCLSCLCSTSCFCVIVSTAWIAHRPFLATFGLTIAGLICGGVYYYLHMKEEESVHGGQVAFLASHNIMQLFKFKWD